MRFEIVHVTDHALLRWIQRVSKNGNVFEITNAIKKSKIIKKYELIPYPLPRKEGTVYSIYNGIVFVMEPITIKEYRLVTVVSGCYIPVYQPPRKPNKEEKTLKKKKQLLKIKQNKKNREENDE